MMFRALAAVAALGLSMAAGTAEAQQRPSRAAFMFSYADRDGDGLLSSSEFGLILYPATPRSVMSDLPSLDMSAFRMADSDGSGSVTLEEFSAWFAREWRRR